MAPQVSFSGQEERLPVFRAFIVETMALDMVPAALHILSVDAGQPVLANRLRFSLGENMLVTASGRKRHPAQK
jgi:hypothetical protein